MPFARSDFHAIEPSTAFEHSVLDDGSAVIKPEDKGLACQDNKYLPFVRKFVFVRADIRPRFEGVQHPVDGILVIGMKI